MGVTTVWLSLSGVFVKHADDKSQLQQVDPSSEICVPAETLIALLYSELRRLADARLRGERADHTLTATALVHEAYLRLTKERHLWESKAHFFAAAALAMKRILVDHHRRRAAAKRGGEIGRAEAALPGLSAPELDQLDVPELDAALSVLERVDAEAHRVVMLKYFAGMALEDIAAMLGVSERTVTRRWNIARAWLFERLNQRRDGAE